MPAGLDELLAAQALEVLVEVLGHLAGEQRGERPAVEGLAHHRRGLEHRPLAWCEPVDAGGQEGVDRQRHLDLGQVDGDPPCAVHQLQHAVVDEHAHELPDEERVALAGRRDPVEEGVGQVARRRRAPA